MNRLATLFSVVLLFVVGTAAAQVPRVISHQGILTDNTGTPISDGAHSVTVRFYASPAAADAIFEESHNVVSVSGLFSILIGRNQPLDLPFDTQYFVGFSVDGAEEMSPRLPLTSAPYSLNSARIDSAALANLPDGSIPPSALDGSDGTDGQVITLSGGEAGWADPPGGGGGSITSVTGADGVAGGGNTGDLVLTLDTNFSDDRYAGSDHEHGAITGDMILDGSITPDHMSTDGGSDGQFLGIAGGAAEWLDLPDSGGDGDITAVNAGTGLSGGGESGSVTLSFDTSFGDNRYVTDAEDIGIDKISTAGGSNGQVLTISGGNTSWQSPVGGGDITDVNAGSGLTGGGSFGSVTLNFDNAFGDARYVEEGEASSVSTSMLESSAVTTGKIANKTVSLAKLDDAGALKDQVIKFKDGSIKWAADETGGGGLTLPFDGSTSNGETAAFKATNTSASGNSSGVWGRVSATSGGSFSAGVRGENSSTTGFGIGVYGTQNGSGWGVYGTVGGTGSFGRGVYGRGNGGGVGVYGAVANATEFGLAGFFDGNVQITGALTGGTAGLKIDHPLDPENMYLLHSSVESPDMMNVYNGNIQLDANGEAIVRLPSYFEALNEDFRYQLTAVGAPGPGLYVAEEVADNQFRIAGGTPGMKVSWQVSGIRDDPYARKNRREVEVQKPAHTRGLYLHAEAYGVDASLSENRSSQNDTLPGN